VVVVLVVFIPGAGLAPLVVELVVAVFLVVAAVLVVVFLAAGAVVVLVVVVDVCAPALNIKPLTARIIRVDFRTFIFVLFYFVNE
jgi:nitrate/nitrite transporter NarK